MYRQIRLAIATLIFSCTLLWVAAPIAAVEGWEQAPASGKPDRTETIAKPGQVRSCIERWVDELSRHKEYAEWKKADFRLYPLGPGSHSWVAILERDGREIGYLVAAATAEGEWILMEYGTGEYPLFSLNTLHRALMQHGLIPDSWTVGHLENEPSLVLERSYEPPFMAVWKVHTERGVFVFDAKTGEVYPPESANEGDQGAQPAQARPDRRHAIRLSGDLAEIRTELFDPFHHLFWVRDREPAPPYDAERIMNHLKAGLRCVYTVRIMDGSVTLPFAVTGIQRWGTNPPAVMLDHYGPRTFSYTVLAEYGDFHLQSGQHQP